MVARYSEESSKGPKVIKDKETRCAFVVIKLKIGGSDYFILRRDKDWNDLNLIGGHQEVSDNGKFERTAKREMFEELSALRGRAKFALAPITDKILYGPVWSESAKKQSTYRVQIYLAKLQEDPTVLEKTLTPRSMNFLVDSNELEGAIERKDVSAFVEVLENNVLGGLSAIPYSWDSDLVGVIDNKVLQKTFQKQMALDLDAVNHR